MYRARTTCFAVFLCLAALASASGTMLSGANAGEMQDAVPPATWLAQAAIDTVAESAPAPLLIPGRSTTADTANIPKAKQASEQFNLGLALEKINPGAAVVGYRSAVILDPTYPEANYRAGLILTAHGMLHQAAQAFAAEIKNNPAHLEANLELGSVQSQLGYHELAIARMESLTVARPNDDKGWHALGFVYNNAERKDLAEEALRRAIRLAPRRAIEHRDLGVLFASQGRDAEARVQYRRSLSIDDDDATVWFNLGNLERKEGRPKRALEQYRKAEARDSSFWLARRGQVEVLMELDRVDEVAAVFERHLERHPEAHDVRLAAVRYYEQYGEPGQAMELARQGVQLFPLEGEAHMVLGRTRAKHGDYRGALKSYMRALDRTVLPNHRREIETLIAALKADAPDSLKAMFHPDSLAKKPQVQRKQERP